MRSGQRVVEEWSKYGQGVVKVYPRISRNLGNCWPGIRPGQRTVKPTIVHQVGDQFGTFEYFKLYNGILIYLNQYRDIEYKGFWNPNQIPKLQQRFRGHQNVKSPARFQDHQNVKFRHCRNTDSIFEYQIMILEPLDIEILGCLEFEQKLTVLNTISTAENIYVNLLFSARQILLHMSSLVVSFRADHIFPLKVADIPFFTLNVRFKSVYSSRPV